MNTNLAPKHITRIGDCYLLWFESSNRYTVISSDVFKLLSNYLKSTSEVQFISELHRHKKLNELEAAQISKDICEFLNDSNTKSSIGKARQVTIPLPEFSNTRCYQIGQKTIKINFESEDLENLIHPQLSHYCVPNMVHTLDYFSIFKTNTELHLYKNDKPVLSCHTSDYHLLQGQFALELINILYQKKEDNWLATLHASTICNDKEAIMLVGDSGNGKSTFSALLMAYGFDLLADDFTPMLANSFEVYRYPAGISIKEGAFHLFDNKHSNFKEIKTYTNPNKQTRVKYIPTTVDFNTAKKSFPCHKIVLVTYDSHSETQLIEAAPEDVLQTLIPDSWISPNSSHAKLFMEWLNTVTFYKLTYSDSSLAIKEFESLF